MAIAIYCTTYRQCVEALIIVTYSASRNDNKHFMSVNTMPHFALIFIIGHCRFAFGAPCRSSAIYWTRGYSRRLFQRICLLVSPLYCAITRTAALAEKRMRFPPPILGRRRVRAYLNSPTFTHCSRLVFDELRADIIICGSLKLVIAFSRSLARL